MRSITSLIAVLAVTPFISVTAQQQPPFKPGNRVRITAPGGFAPTGTVTFVAVSTDTLVVRLGTNTWSVPIAAVTRLEVSRGRKSFGTRRGAIIGGLVGAVSGAIIGAASYEEPAPCVPKTFLDCVDFDVFQGGTSTAVSTAVAGAVLGAVAGAAIGGLLGSVIKTERWEGVALYRLRVSVVPQRDGRFALGFSVAL
jgi:hypothetical protein